MTRPLYPQSVDSRLAAIERRTASLERRPQTAAALGTVNAIHLYDTSAQSIPDTNDTNVVFAHVSAFDSTVFGTHTVAGKVDTVTLKKPGVYASFMYVTWATNFTGNQWAYHLANFGPIITPQMASLAHDAGSFNGDFPMLSYVRTFPAALAGDAGTTTLAFYLGQQSGTAKNTAVLYCEFMYLGATDH